MSWHCLPELAEASLGESYSAGELSAPSKWTPTLVLCCLPASATDALIHSLFGTTFGPLTETLGAGELMSSAEDFPARTSASQERERESKEVALDCGPAWRGSLAKYDQTLSTWRTAQRSLLGELDEFSVTWPSFGMTRSGVLFQRPMSAPTTGGSASGLLPTLTVNGNYNRKGASATSGDGLATALMATLCARDYRYPGRSRLERTGSKQGECLPQQVGGPLNPTWCEWFMGFPEGWTELKPLEMRKFQEWQQQHLPTS